MNWIKQAAQQIDDALESTTKKAGMKKKLTAIGIKKKGERGFRINTEPKPEPKPATVIHNNSKVKRCSVCGHILNAPEGTCVTCEICGSQFGGCG